MLRESEESVRVGRMSILTFEELSAQPSVFKSMTGVSVEEFGSMLAQVSPRYQALAASLTERADRRRAPGGGRKSRHDVSERLLMTLVWLRLYLTVEAVGFLFGVDKSTVSRFTRPILLILRDLGVDTLGWPEEAKALTQAAAEDSTRPDPPPDSPPAPRAPEERRPESDEAPDRGSLVPGAAESPPKTDEVSAEPAVMTPDESRCPDHLAIIDATEQRVERSSDYATQKQYYSGKRKSHTIKTQVIVNERGRIRHVSDSVPGSTHDLTLLRESGVKDELPEGLTVTADTGYRGLQNDFPDRSVALPYRPKAHQRLTPEEKLHNHMISRVRIVVENTLAQLKHFRALNTVFRHCLDRYNEITRAIAGIVNGRIDKRLANLPA